MKGRVKWFNEKKGFGFISAGPHGTNDYFFHFSGIKGDGSSLMFRSLQAGDEVTFEVFDQPDGRKKAVDIIKIPGKSLENDGLKSGETGEIPEEKVM